MHQFSGVHRIVWSHIKSLLKSQDELSFRNIRAGFWPVLLVFPISVIIGNLRFYQNSIALAGLESDIVMLFPLGLGWLLVALLPKKLIIPVLRIAVIFSAVLMLFPSILPMGFWHSIVYMFFKFFNVLCVACTFYLFCFVLNNVERLFCLIIIQTYYGIYYSTWRTIPVIHTVGSTWGSIFLIAFLLFITFSIKTEQHTTNTERDGKGSGVPFVIGLSVVHYMIMCMNNYIEWTDNAVSAPAFGIGIFISIGIIIILQVLFSRNAMYIWLIFLVFSLLGLALLLIDKPMAFIFGSLQYGIGDSLGYIIIFYMCAGAIKQSQSLRMFRFYCLASFSHYVFISGMFSFFFRNFEEQNKFLAFGVVLVLVCLCLLCMPFIQKKLFEADWTDGLYLQDMEEFTNSIAVTEELNDKNQLNL